MPTFPHPYVAVLDTTINGSGGLLYVDLPRRDRAGAVVRNCDAERQNLCDGIQPGTDFPSVGAYQAANAGGYDAFVSILDPTQSGTGTLTYSTYFGGTGNDVARSIAVDASGVVYVSGYTFSTNFPVTGRGLRHYLWRRRRCVSVQAGSRRRTI